MRKRFPRVSKRTMLKPGKPAVAKLPKLPMAIYREGELVNVVNTDDPRERICNTFNEVNPLYGLYMVPMADDAGVSQRGSRKAVANG